jgi:4a-hydroxytetrahydrobiopterin dehydratase
MSALTAKEIKYHLNSVPAWTKHGQTISRTIQFAGFLKSIDFVNLIARQAQKFNHHPDIDIRYNRVTLTLSTHDEGGITEKDFVMARQCDEVFNKFFGWTPTLLSDQSQADLSHAHPVRERGLRARA